MPFLMGLAFDGKYREWERSHPVLVLWSRWPHWRSTLSQLSRCRLLCSHLLHRGSRASFWMNEIVIKYHTMPEPSKFLSKNFRGKKRTKFIIFYFFKLRGKKGCQGKGWTSCKEIENEALKDIVHTPPKKSALISVRITEDLDIFYIFFSEV